MTPEEQKAFAHHDHICKAQRGDKLLACEAFRATNMDEGGAVDISPGQTLRVGSSSESGIAPIFCDVAVRGRVVHVAVSPRDFHAVEITK